MQTAQEVVGYGGWLWKRFWRWSWLAPTVCQSLLLDRKACWWRHDLFRCRHLYKFAQQQKKYSRQYRPIVCANVQLMCEKYIKLKNEANEQRVISLSCYTKQNDDKGSANVPTSLRASIQGSYTREWNQAASTSFCCLLVGSNAFLKRSSRRESAAMRVVTRHKSSAFSYLPHATTPAQQRFIASCVVNRSKE